MSKWDITVGREVIDTIEADGIRVEGGLLLFYDEVTDIAAVGLNEGIVVKRRADDLAMTPESLTEAQKRFGSVFATETEPSEAL